MDIMELATSMDVGWTLVAAALVFFMQAGFAMVETGFTRAKNAGNIIMKNLMDFSLGTPIFWILGFGIMFGAASPFFGGFDFFADGVVGEGYDWTTLIFQTVFCATAATIVSGSMAERTKFSAYCIYSMIISAVIYPVSGHWIWGGGWLQDLGFHDFAGSTCVHMVGGICALVGAWIHYGKPDVSMTLNGGLAGLVAITAGCDVVSDAGAFIIGVISSAAIIFLVEFIDQKMKIDDPVGAVAAHGGCGALGTILTGLFSVKDGLLYTGETHYFLIQVFGVCVVALYVFRILNATMGLRVSPEEEINGLDFEEHSIYSAYAGFMITPDTMTQAIDAGKAPQGAVEVPLDKTAPAAASVAAMPADGHHLYNVTILTDEKRFESLKGAMEAIGITGMTITRALGFGIENTSHDKRTTKRARRLTRQPFFWYNRRGIFFSRGAHYGY